MALLSPPAWTQDGLYSAKMDRQVLSAFIESSGVASASSLQVSKGSAHWECNISPGGGYIVGKTSSFQGTYHVYNTEMDIKTLDPADTLHPRYDLICVVIRDAEVSGTISNATIEPIKGIPSGSPGIPTAPGTSIPLAVIYIPANSTEILSSNITDLRVPARFNNGLTRGLVPISDDWKAITTYVGPFTPYSVSTGSTVFADPQYKKLGDYVYLEGLMKSSKAIAAPEFLVGTELKSPAFKLPEGYRPKNTQMVFSLVSGLYITKSGAASAGTAHTHPWGFPNWSYRLDISSDGTATVVLPYGDVSSTYYGYHPSGAWYSLSGIRFPIS